MNHKTDMQAPFEHWVTTVWRPDNGAELLSREYPRMALAAWEAAVVYIESKMQSSYEEAEREHLGDHDAKTGIYASRPDAQADERGAFDIALNALQRYQDEWDTGLPSEYAQSERIQMECACEAVREALQEARAAAPRAEAAHGVPEQGVPEGWVKLAEHAKSLRGLYFNTNLCPEGFRNAVECLSDEATKLLAAAPSPDREQAGEAEKPKYDPCDPGNWRDGDDAMGNVREFGEPPAENAVVRNKIAAALHYPDHWDTAAYPTLDDAAWEAMACAKLTCSECGERQGALGHDPSIVRAGLIGLAKHVRACPAYAKLVGDMTIVDWAIELLDTNAPTLGEQEWPSDRDSA
ncbi:MAG: hypothetical protein KGQ57_10645, partial [Burkholderiales bacterium]|nr:hypothetical protein [Burkholderiales bacterium]